MTTLCRRRFASLGIHPSAGAFALSTVFCRLLTMCNLGVRTAVPRAPQRSARTMQLRVRQTIKDKGGRHRSVRDFGFMVHLLNLLAAVALLVWGTQFVRTGIL